MRTVGLAALVAATFALAACGEDTPEGRAAVRCKDTTMAFVMSQKAVKRQLKAPDSASFPTSTADGVNVTAVEGCKFQVVAYVDAVNSFGAKLRSRYSAVMAYDAKTDRWSASQVRIAGP